jgi:hypothetical protein
MRAPPTWAILVLTWSLTAIVLIVIAFMIASTTPWPAIPCNSMRAEAPPKLLDRE